MGSLSSKAVGAASRKFPTRLPPTTSMQSPPITHPQPPNPPSSGISRKKQLAAAPSEAQGQPDLDDTRTTTDFSARLNKMGIVDVPDPYAAVPPQSSRHRVLAHNPTLTALETRRRIQDRVQDFDGSASRAGYVDISTIRRILLLRGRGSSPAEIEKALGLPPGAADKLGRPGVLSPV